jgi:hypothetical protein
VAAVGQRGEAVDDVLDLEVVLVLLGDPDLVLELAKLEGLQQALG